MLGNVDKCGPYWLINNEWFKNFPFNFQVKLPGYPQKDKPFTEDFLPKSLDHES